MEPAGKILPVYFVADESGSMAPHMDSLNRGLTSLLGALQGEPFAASTVRFSIIGFGSNAVTHLEPTDLRLLGEMPTLSIRGSTSYKSAFDELQYRLPLDIQSFKQENYKVLRPAVFFLSDGAPDSEDWASSRAQVLTPAARPNILAFGIGAANGATISQVATRPEYAFIAEVDTGAALQEFIAALTRSVVSSGNSVASGGELVIEPPTNFTIAAEEV